MQLPFFLPPLLNLSFPQTSTQSTSLLEVPCPFLGQLYPPPTHITSTETWKDAVTSLNQVFDTFLPLQDNTTSYAIRLVSLHDSTPLFEHYNRASNHIHGKNGVAPVNQDTVFRIASVSKLFTVYALLLKSGFRCFEDPITKYIPELKSGTAREDISHVDWEEVTVGALASQLSGIARDTALGDLASNPAFMPGTQYGLPDLRNLDPADLPTCGASPDEPPCGRKEAIERIKRDKPTFPTWYTPSYANIGFQLLGFVLENITGQPYDQILQETIATPLNLKHLSTSPPHNINNTVHIPGDPMFGWDFGSFNPTGGIYTSVHDLTTHALSVLNHTQLSPSQTRRWLKPQSHTSNLRVSVGSPWEIGRAQGLSPFHTIDIYTKGGSLPPYTTAYGILPDLNIAYAVNCLTTSPSVSAPVLAGLVLQLGLKPIYEIAKSQALARFGGTYTGHNQSRLVVTVDQDVGLVLAELVSNGTDVLELLRELGVGPRTVRLFPSSLTSVSPADGKGQVAFRASIINDGGACASWGEVGGLRWAGEALDLLVFETQGGNATAVHLPAFRTTYRRVQTEEEAEMAAIELQEL